MDFGTYGPPKWPTIGDKHGEHPHDSDHAECMYVCMYVCMQISTVPSTTEDVVL